MTDDIDRIVAGHKLHPDLVAAVAEVSAAKARLDEIARAVEAECPHTFWGGVDWRGSDYFSSMPGVYICLHCRMEVHVDYGNYVNGFQEPPSDSIVLSASRCGASEVYGLRLGDARPPLKSRYSYMKDWPVRARIIEMEKGNG